MTSKRKTSSLSIQQILLLLSVPALSALLAYIGQMPLPATLSMGAYFLVALLSFERERIYFLSIFPFFIAYLGAIASNVYLEKGAYISEQYDYSSATGSTFRLVFYSSLLMISAGISLRLLLPMHRLRSLVEENTGRRDAMFTLTMGVLATCLLVLWIANFVFGMPIAQGLTRFDYWKDHPLPQLRTILVQLSQLAFVLGWLHGSTESHKQRRRILVFLAFIFITNVSYGSKFSSNFLSLTNFGIASLTARFLLSPHHKMRLGRVVTTGLVLAGIFYLLISWFYSNIDKIDADLVNAYIVDRILALQGHTWWGVDYLVKNEFRAGGAFDLFREHTDDNPGGLYMLMYAISPTRAVNSYLENGITYTMGGTAIAIYTLGYWGACLYLLLAGIIVGLTLAYLLRKSAQFQFFRALIALKIVWIEVLAFNMGNSYLMVGPSIAVYVAAVLFDFVILRERSVTLFHSIPKIKLAFFRLRKS